MRGLHNLACVDAPYANIERTIKAFVMLAYNSISAASGRDPGQPVVRRMCAQALCQLADLKSVRLRMVEEGIVPSLSNLCKSGGAKGAPVTAADVIVRRACAAVRETR